MLKSNVGVLTYVADGNMLMKNTLFGSGESCAISIEEGVIFHTATESIILLIETIVQRREQDSENIYG